MQDYDEIERVLRRVEFNSSEEKTIEQAIAILRDLGYGVTETCISMLMSNPPIPVYTYDLEIGGGFVRRNSTSGNVIAFVTNTCADYRDSDTAKLAEYVKRDLAELKDFGLTDKINKMNDVSQHEFISLLDSDDETICCGDQIEALSDRIERLERAAKSKDVSSFTSISEASTTWPEQTAKPFWSINPGMNQKTYSTTGDTTFTNHHISIPSNVSTDEIEQYVVEQLNQAGLAGAKAGNELKAVLAERQAIVEFIKERASNTLDNVLGNPANWQTGRELLSLAYKIEDNKHNG